MRICFLVTSQMKPLPSAVKELMNFGNVKARFEGADGQPPHYISGDHCIVEGEPEVIKEWLKSFDAIAIGEGVPQLQQFTIMHTKDD